MQKLFLHVHVVSVHVCACVYFSSVQTSWRPSVLCGTAMMPTHKTHSAARLMNHSPFTQIYMFIHKQTHAGFTRAHRNNYRGCFVYFGNMIFQAQKHWVSYSASFSHRKELRSRCLPDLFIFYAGEIIIIMNKLFTVAVISSGAVMHWCKHIIASVGEFWTNVQKFGVGTIILMFLKSLMLTKAAFIWWKIQ